MIFAAFGACGKHLRRHRRAGICRDGNMPPNEYAANEYAEKKEGWQEPGIFRNSPTLSFRIRR